MRRISSALALVLFFTTSAFAKEKSRVTIHVVGTQAGQRTYTTPGSSSATCNTEGQGTLDATTYGNNTDGTIHTSSTTKCSGTSTAPSVHSIRQEYVHAIMPDGTKVTLWCQAGFRKCAELLPGNYSAEVKGDTVWVHARSFSGKESKIKYRASFGNW